MATQATATHYLLVMRHTRYFLVGPFATQLDASVWGRRPANNPNDDPRWQTIELLPDHLLPTQLSPTEASDWARRGDL